MEKRAKIKKKGKSAIASDSPLSAKICIMSAKCHLCSQSATASARRPPENVRSAPWLSGKRHMSAQRHYKGPLSATNVRQAPKEECTTTTSTSTTTTATATATAAAAATATATATATKTATTAPATAAAAMVTTTTTAVCITMKT